MRKTLIGSLAVLALAGTACSKSSDTTATPNTGPTHSEAGCTAASAKDLSTDDPFTVTIVNFAFQPNCFTAKSSSSITIHNEGDTTHTFTIDGTPVDVSLNAGKTFNGESAGLEPGTYPFHCKIHTQMTGTVIVT
jgi:plastocyanin